MTRFSCYFCRKYEYTGKGINITLLDAYLVAFKKLGQHDQRQLKASPISLFVLDGNGCEISVSKV